jgi:hypothetical protein
MNPIASYLRHIIVTGIILLIAKLKLPVEGADAFADGIALFAIGTLTWAMVKYAPALAKFLGLMLLVLPCVLFMPSCVTSTITTTRTYPDGTKEETVTKLVRADQNLIGEAAGIALPLIIPEK